MFDPAAQYEPWGHLVCSFPSSEQYHPAVHGVLDTVPPGNTFGKYFVHIPSAVAESTVGRYCPAAHMVTVHTAGGLKTPVQKLLAGQLEHNWSVPVHDERY